MTGERSIVPALAGQPRVDGKLLIVTMTLPVLPESMASMLLYPSEVGVRPSVRIPCEPRSATETELTGSIDGVPPDRYLFSVEIDGVASLLDMSDGRYTGPLVVVQGEPRR